MRCKNCGTENDDSRYICENCGSPLYDEYEMPQNTENEDQPTNDRSTAPISQGIPPVQPPENRDSYEDKSAQKRSIAIIAILCVVLVAVIIGIAVAAHNKTTDTVSTSDTQITSDDKTTTEDNFTTTEEKTDRTTEKTTTTTTKKPTTTKATTTTTTTTTAASFNVYVDVNGNGSVTGDGSYSTGSYATLTATPSDGNNFEGWYEGGTYLGNGTTYRFKVTNETTITAVFTVAEGTE